MSNSVKHERKKGKKKKKEPYIPTLTCRDLDPHKRHVGDSYLYKVGWNSRAIPSTNVAHRCHGRRHTAAQRNVSTFSSRYKLNRDVSGEPRRVLTGHHHPTVVPGNGGSYRRRGGCGGRARQRPVDRLILHDLQLPLQVATQLHQRLLKVNCD